MTKSAHDCRRPPLLARPALLLLLRRRRRWRVAAYIQLVVDGGITSTSCNKHSII
jgi:hypothetical protein